MKKRLSLLCLLLAVITVFAFSLTACNKEVGTLESLQNEYGVTVTGGGFEKGSILITEEIKADTVEGAAALAAIADKEYDKDGRVLILEIHVIREKNKIQPKDKVRISIPNPNADILDYVIFHIKSDNSVEEIIPTVADGKLSFEVSSFSRFVIAKKAKCVHDWGEFRMIERATCTSKGKTERTCKLCGATEQRDTPESDHSYGEFVLVEENDCLRTGKAVRTCSVCGDEDIAFVLGDHAYGEWIEAKEPTLNEEGCIGHYKCGVCGNAFDEDKNPIANAILPKLAPKLSLCLDGVPCGEFVTASESENDTTFIISDLDVLAGQRVTICDTENPANLRKFTVSEKVLASIGAPILGNIDPEEKTIRTDSRSTVTVIYNVDGSIKLSMDGYTHSGVVIEMKNRYTTEPVMFPMEYVSYYGGDMGAYVFGIFGSDQYTSFRIIDLETDTVYDYDDISESMAWNTWSYSKAKDGSIAFGSDVSEWWVAFSIGGDGKILLKRIDRASVNNPVLTSGGESIPMEKVDLEVGSDEYKYHTWPLLNGKFYRTELWIGGDFPINLENIFLFKAVVDVEAGDSFDLSIGASYMKAADHICDIRTASGAVSINGNTIKFNTAGKYVIEVVSYCSIINIYEYVETTPDPEPHEHVYVDGKCECGEVDPDYAPSHKHEYVDSKCECGAVDSNYKGIVIEINGEKFAMNFETYPSDEKTSYVYGYVYINAGDKLLIRDTESGAVWGYDDIDEAFSWNTWDYHSGDNGEIVFDFTARYAFEFDCDGCKKLYITKAFAPNHGESFGIGFEGEREDVIFDSFDLSESADAEGEFMWMLSQDTTMNCSDFTEYISENGLWFYYAIIDLEEGERFSLKNLTTGDTIGADYLVDITGDITAVTREGDLVSVEKSGSFYIVYLPAFNSFSIECDTTDPLSIINLYAGDKAITLTPDEDGNIFYEGFESATYHIISIDDARYSPLPIILDESMDKTLVDLTVSGDYYTAYPTKEGIYNLRYNVYTGVLYLEYVGGVEEEETVPYQIYISYDHKLSLKQSTDNPDEYYHLAVTMGAWDEIKVLDSNLDYITNMTLAAGTTDIVTNGSIITFQTGGTYDFYINKTTHEVRFVASTGGGDVGGDVEIDFSDGLYLGVDYEDIRVYPNEDGDVKYIGLEVTDDTVILMKTLDYEYLPIILDETVSSSIASVYISDDYYMLFFYKNGTVNITYNVYTGIMHIEMTSVTLEGAKVVLFNNGSMTNAYSDADGNVVFERFVLEKSGSIILMDAAYEYLPIVLDPEMDTTLASLYEYEGTTMLIINGAGTYNLYYNLTTNVVLLEAVPET
ncbi:MAG: hypothetical protein IJW02_07910 [Clostridia bacterium]|nr:hypothetical protein [Clostridia bacterium]